MDSVKQGDTAYVVATCADTWKRGSGVCWFYENGGCPYCEDGKLNYCGEGENVLDVFKTKVELVEPDGILLQGITFGFTVLCETVSPAYVGTRIFASRPDAVAALERIEQEIERMRQERERERERKRRKCRERRQIQKQARLVLTGQCSFLE